MSYNPNMSLIYGPMFSGKTKRLIRAIGLVKPKVHRLVFKHRSDNRTNETLSSHDAECNDVIEATPIRSLFQVTEWITPKTTHIFIDELQFFETGDAIDAIKRITSSWPQVKFVFAGLNLDWQGKSFPTMNAIRKLVDPKEQHFCQGECKVCGCPTTHSYLVAHEGETRTTIVAGEEAYEGRCAPCFGRGMTEQRKIIKRAHDARVDNVQ